MNPLQHAPCRTFSRREWLARAGGGFGGVALAALFADTVAAKEKTHHPAKAKRVIHLFLEGGPSHLDTFDPKPILLAQSGKPIPLPDDPKRTMPAFGSPFKFAKHGKSGLEISELFPELAKRADDLCVLRGMHTSDPAHDTAMLMMNCGHPRFARPSVGSWVGYGLGTENANLPGFVAVCDGGFPLKGTENWQAAFLPGTHQGTPVLTTDGTSADPIPHLTSRTTGPDEQRQQLELLKALDTKHAAARPADERLETRIASFELAARMQTEAGEAFDIARESEKTRELYGDTTAGRQCLLARRLAERGVRFVQCFLGDWDHHGNLAEGLRSQAEPTDRAIAALLADLSRTGLLKDTLVVIGGEFGRTPTADPGSGGDKLGRDHNHRGFSVVLAGGGVKGGTAYGATDEFGFAAAEGKVHVHDLHATILHLLGLDHTRLTYRYAGRDFRLTDVSGEVVKGVLA
jgi:hypothetical protein